MPEVNVSINNRDYSLDCDEGQEKRLVEIAKYVDARLSDIAQAGAATNESHLLVLTALVLADEVFDLKHELGAAEMDNYQLVQQLQNVESSDEEGYSDEEELFFVQAIEHLAGKIEHISQRIQKA